MCLKKLVPADGTHEEESPTRAARWVAVGVEVTLPQRDGTGCHIGAMRGSMGTRIMELQEEDAAQHTEAVSKAEASHPGTARDRVGWKKV